MEYMCEYEMETVVVTRHPGLVEYLVGRGVVDASVPVIAHATVEQVRGKRVVGVLPLGLATEAAEIVEVQLDMPREMRGVEMDAAQVEQYAVAIVTYTPPRVIDRTLV